MPGRELQDTSTGAKCIVKGANCFPGIASTDYMLKGAHKRKLKHSLQSGAYEGCPESS